MILGAPAVIEADETLGEFDQALQQTPPHPAVFLIWPSEGSPYMARTASLRRRLLRLLKAREKPSRLLNLRDVVSRVEYWLTASRLESSLASWELGRRHFPETYRKLLKLRLPPYVKLILTNRFPRTQVTRRLSGARSLFYGPFRGRAAAEHFEGAFLDLFQVRRCPEDLDPSPSHPGCIYGEMNRCLRPCQQVVGDDEYSSEVSRVGEFLSTNGRSLLVSIAGAREKLSGDLEFEDAAREHARYERVQQVLKLSDDLATDIDRLNGVAVTRSTQSEAVELWFMQAGRWLPAKRFSLGLVDGRPIPMDPRLRELAAQLQPAKTTVEERTEHLALLARWFYSSWRDGEWLPFEKPDALPYRKLVNAIRRVASGPDSEPRPKGAGTRTTASFGRGSAPAYCRARILPLGLPPLCPHTEPRGYLRLSLARRRRANDGETSVLTRGHTSSRGGILRGHDVLKDGVKDSGVLDECRP